MTDVLSIINTGQKVWDVVKGGKKAPEVDGAAANAIPAGHDPMTDLDMWMGPSYYQFRYFSENRIAGIRINTISDVYLSLQFSFAGHHSHGKLRDKGMYLNNVRVTLDSGDSSMGGDLHIRVETGTPENVGRRGYPVAGLPVHVMITDDPIYTWNAHSETYKFYVMGTGAMYLDGNPLN